ncbi:hypothetical protein F5884DRAFT_749691 [Xylogone sp. PMI_703]|nr:hypothetical protein F5884DRAFT_749691 [Xylogone sp. PMI_703]
MPKTWFLPPDFTFNSEPVLLERNHHHESSASSSIKSDAKRHSTLKYGKVDHEIPAFAEPLSATTVSAITAIHEVRDHINPGIFGKSPVYIISGLRIAKSSFSVTKEAGSSFSGNICGSGPPAGTVPVEVGGGIAHQKKMITGSYNTAPDIVFAYRMHVIRPKRAGFETELFSNMGAFLTSDGKSEEPIVLVEATKEEVDEDLEEMAELATMTVGDEEYCFYPTEHSVD